MINTLNKDEIGCVSGGWVCDSTYNGELFLKAVWHSKSKNNGFGACHYGAEEGESYYDAPKNIIEIVQEPINFWMFDGDKIGGYTKYECHESNASKCVFREA